MRFSRQEYWSGVAKGHYRVVLTAQKSAWDTARVTEVAQTTARCGSAACVPLIHALNHGLYSRGTTVLQRTQVTCSPGSLTR